MFCDLHIHSVFSDGTDTPEQIVRRAEALGLTAIALTDHNTVAGLPRFRAAGLGKSLTLIPGVELSTDYQGTELHILGLFLTPEQQRLVDGLTDLPRQRKHESNLRLARALTSAGFPIDYEAVAAEASGGNVNRAHFARVLAHLGYVKSEKEAFDTLLRPGVYYQPPQRLGALEAIAFLREIGAVSVLAHPYLDLEQSRLEEFLARAVPAGLDAMETVYAEYDAETTCRARQTAARFGLAQSGGSDYHGTIKPGLSLGTGRGNLAVPEEFYQRLAALRVKKQKGTSAP